MKKRNGDAVTIVSVYSSLPHLLLLLKEIRIVVLWCFFFLSTLSPVSPGLLYSPFLSLAFCFQLFFSSILTPHFLFHFLLHLFLSLSLPFFFLLLPPPYSLDLSSYSKFTGRGRTTAGKIRILERHRALLLQVCFSAETPTNIACVG